MRGSLLVSLVLAPVLVVGVLHAGEPDVAATPAVATVTAVGQVTDPRLDPLTVSLDDLSPAVTAAHEDRSPVERYHCHARSAVPRICTFGHKSRVMVAFGDSHMAHWFPALRRAARVTGYRLLWASKPGCPAPLVSSPYDECMVWRAGLLDRLTELPRIDLAVIGGSSWGPMLWPGTDTLIGTASERAEQWRIGMDRTIRRLSPNTRRFMVIRDTPRLWIDVPDCLLGSSGGTRPCSRTRSSSLQPGFWQAERSLAERYDRVTAVQFSSWFCARVMCRPVTSSHIIRFRDGDHMTNTFAAALSGLMTRHVRQASR
jgi:hypothetical protein